jgi:uncharacterized MAPEG superfamily protein
MGIEFTALLIVSLLAIGLPLVYGPGAMRALGVAALAGNRDNLGEVPGWPGRGLRAHRNLIENLVPFAALALMAHALGVSNGLTRTGAWLFLLARLAHPVFYIGGLAPLRSLSHVVNIAGIVLLAVALIGAR